MRTRPIPETSKPITITENTVNQAIEILNEYIKQSPNKTAQVSAAYQIICWMVEQTEQGRYVLAAEQGAKKYYTKRQAIRREFFASYLDSIHPISKGAQK